MVGGDGNCERECNVSTALNRTLYLVIDSNVAPGVILVANAVG